VPPLFGDTTSSQAIIFSAPFADAPFDEPSYPNYTLPQGNLSAPPNIPTPPAQTLLVYPTSNISSLVSRVNASFCAMVEIPGNVAGSGKPLSTSDVLRDADGWRTQWVLEGLTPSTNYTVFVISDEALVSPPLYISTKSCKGLLHQPLSNPLTKLRLS
jgi:calcium channel MID1